MTEQHRYTIEEIKNDRIRELEAEVKMLRRENATQAQDIDSLYKQLLRCLGERTRAENDAYSATKQLNKERRRSLVRKP